MSAESGESAFRSVSIRRILLAAAPLALCVVALLVPAIQFVGSERRSPCKRNLKQIGLALHNYHEAQGSFPPAYIADSNGNPLLSWRVLILPHLGEDTKVVRTSSGEMGPFISFPTPCTRKPFGAVF